MNGFVNLLKPPGMTSHDVVGYARRVCGTRSVGHTGTLDPAAAGVLVLAVGHATRLCEYLSNCDKSYRAEITLGLTTDTADAEGRVTGTSEARGIGEGRVREALAALTGEITMRPPAHSAVSVGGKRLYELARAGQTVEAPERRVSVYGIDLLGYAPEPPAASRPTVLLEIHCSKGTYIRSLATMLGEALGCGACLSMLLRTRVGALTVATAATLEQFAADPACYLLSPLEALPHLPRVRVEAPLAARLRNGNSVPLPVARVLGPEAIGLDRPVLVIDEVGRLLCVAALAPGADETSYVLQPSKVLPKTESG